MRPLALISLAILLAAPTAEAKWPKPAAGDSASGDPEVIFTFDDGPDHRFTPRVLRILRERDIQGLFFWVGHRIDQRKKNADLRRAVATRAVLEGHLVGTHTVNHVHLCRLPPAKGSREIDDAIDGMASLTGLPMVLFRAPYGDHCDRVKALLADRQLEHTHWDIDPQEWEDHDSSRVAGDIIHNLRYLDGRAVVLMHDTKLVTVRALEQVLDWIEAENRRRATAGKKQIRIVDASDWMAESIDSELKGFAEDMLGLTLDRLQTARTALVPGYPAKMVAR
jgi:peptidoglycan/xylan/chitin deacetylase (PgdA/CDA1 family)